VYAKTDEVTGGPRNQILDWRSISPYRKWHTDVAVLPNYFVHLLCKYNSRTYFVMLLQ